MHHCHASRDDRPLEGQRIVLVGNPNVGKSIIFGLLTGRYVTVSNYPGTTVEVTYSNANFDGRRYVVIDTPGTNSLIPMSEDERVTRDILLEERPHAVLQVADAKNLRRSLLLSLQLIEMGLPLVLNLNMSDEAMSRGIIIDEKELAEILGVEVVSTVAIQRRGISRLAKALPHARLSGLLVRYDPTIEAALEEITSLLPDGLPSRRAIGLMILAGDESLKAWLYSCLSEATIKRTEAVRQELERRYNEPIGSVINRQRLNMVDEIISRVYKVEEARRELPLATFGRWAMHPVLGLPILILVLLIMYYFVGVFGAGTLVGFMEEVVFGKFINPWATSLVKWLIPISIVQDFLVGEYGLITMALTYSIAIVLPIVGTFFIAFGILEDSGYLPRLAVMVNRIFQVMGLNGKAVLPMILGLGCDTMATLTARILESRKERIIVTLLLALGVPCSAQLGVIMAMLGSISPWATLIWAGVILNTMFLVGYLATFIVPGEPSDFVLEVPPIRRPQLTNLAVKTVARMEWYLKEAVPLFILGTLLLFFSDKFGFLLWVRQVTGPVVSGFLGLPTEATDAFIVGFLRRDYGAAGLYALAEKGLLVPNQVLVSLITMTLFVPCIAQFFVIIKERGLKTALLIAGFIFPFAFLVGGLVRFAMQFLRINL